MHMDQARRTLKTLKEGMMHPHREVLDRLSVETGTHLIRRADDFQLNYHRLDSAIGEFESAIRSAARVIVGDPVKRYTKGIWAIIYAAALKGLLVDSYGENVRIRISTEGAGVVIYADGTAVRCDVELSVTTTIRTQKAIKRVLGL